MGQIEDISSAVTMDAKAPGNVLFKGETKNELGGSHLSLHLGLSGGHVPRVDPQRAKITFQKIHEVIKAGLVRSMSRFERRWFSCRCCGDGNRWSIGIGNRSWRVSIDLGFPTSFYSTANRTIGPLETTAENAEDFEKVMVDAGVPVASIGKVTDSSSISIRYGDKQCVLLDLKQAVEAWQKPLDW